MELQPKQPFWVSRTARAKCYPPLPIFQRGDACDWDTNPWLQQVTPAERSSAYIYCGKSSSHFCQAHSFPIIWRLQGIFSNTPSSDLCRILAVLHHFHNRSFSTWGSRKGFFSHGRGYCVGWCQQNFSVNPPIPKQQPLQWICRRFYAVIEDTISNRCTQKSEWSLLIKKLKVPLAG